MRVVFQCYQCKMIVEFDSNDMLRIQRGELPYPPAGWTHKEHVDGMHYWLCDKCGGEPKH